MRKMSLVLITICIRETIMGCGPSKVHSNIFVIVFIKCVFTDCSEINLCNFFVILFYSGEVFVAYDKLFSCP